MEHEKKKRQKKKKNKQGKTSVSAGVEELTSENNNRANVANQNHQNLNSDSSDVPKRSLQQTVLDSDRESISGAETSRSVEAEKFYWLNREASLEQKIKELQEQLDMQVQREADLERNILQSQKERNLWHHKETEHEKTISQLQTEKHSWLQKENSTAETIASLNKDNAKLRAQVTELETSITNISHQNQQLKEHVSDLQLKIQNLENSVATHLSSERTKHVTAYEDMNSQVESAQALVAKLLSENEILVEKVNILQTELDQKAAATQSSSPIKPDDSLLKNPKASDMDETSFTETDSMPSSAENLESVSDTGPSDKLVNHLNSEGSDLNHISRVSMESGEIVQISLNENDVTAATSAASDPDSVPLTDAPLIGAPFRLISFVARYVSGADLVQK